MTDELNEQMRAEFEKTAGCAPEDYERIDGEYAISRTRWLWEGYLLAVRRAAPSAEASAIVSSIALPVPSYAPFDKPVTATVIRYESESDQPAEASAQHGSAAQAVECAACWGMGYDDVGDERPAAGSACDVCKGSGKAAEGVRPWQERFVPPKLPDFGSIAAAERDAMLAEIADLRAALSRAAFRAHLKQASETVATWPAWKGGKAEQPAEAQDQMVDCQTCVGTGRISPVELCQRCNESGILPAEAQGEGLTDDQARTILHKYSRFIGQGTYSDTEFDCIEDVISFATEFAAHLRAAGKGGDGERISGVKDSATSWDPAIDAAIAAKAKAEDQQL